MLSSLILVPLLAIISVSLNLEPTIVAIAAVVTFWGGLLRILYALIFEPGKASPMSGSNVGFVESVKNNLTGKPSSKASLPEAAVVPADSAFRPPATGNWRDTNDLQPTSVTEETTRTLDKSKIDRN